MNNKIISLSKVFLKDAIQNLKIFNKKKNKKITNSNSFWLIIILAIAVAFISYKGIEVFNRIGQTQIFLNIYFVIFTIFLQMQIILTTVNVLFFSKDLEYILPMPVSGTEILISKYITITVMAYATEMIFLVIPMIIYGLLTHISLLYFIVMPIVLLIFPLFFVTITSILTILLMHIFKFIKNKNICQTVVGCLLIYIVLMIETLTMSTYNEEMLDAINIENAVGIETENAINGEQSENLGSIEVEENNDNEESEVIETNEQEEVERMYNSMAKSYIVVNPSINILAKPNNIGNVLINFGKLILYNIIPMAGLLLIGGKIYLKNVLICVSTISQKEKKKKLNIETELKQKGIAKAYIGQEIKQLLRNPTFFMQLIFPIITVFLVIIIAINGIIPVLEKLIQSNDTVKEAISNIPFTAKTANIILCIIQVLISIPAISLTAISRDGKNAVFTKYVPISLYKQFLYKNAIQVIVNLVVSLIILGVVWVWLPNANLLQIIILFITAIFISIINSFLMLIVDLRRPQINWDSEYEVTKNNQNKIFQYVFMIIMVLVYLYLAKVFNDLKVTAFLAIQLVIFAVVFIIINLLIKKNIEKLFEKIN